MRREGLARLWTVIAIVVIASAALGALGYALELGLIGGLTSHSGNPYLVALSGSIVFPPTSGAGELNITVRNTSNSPISRIWVSNASDLPDAANVEFRYANGAVSQANVVPIGRVTTALGSVRNVTAGASYTVTVSMMFQNGAQEIQTPRRSVPRIS